MLKSAFIARSESKSLRNFAEAMGDQAPDLEGDVVAILWPGDNRLSPLSYSVEEKDADETAKRLGSLIAQTLKPKRVQKLSQHPGLYDARAVRRARNLYEFDDLVTAPLHGFASADD